MVKNFRNMIDLDPSGGDSFWGLRRMHAKKLALAFIIVGLFFADPPGGLLPFNDFINLWFAKVLTENIGIFNLITWTIITYTFIAWGLIIIGAYIYPHNTKRILNGIFIKISKAVRKGLKNPLVIIISLFIFYHIFKWYQKTLLG